MPGLENRGLCSTSNSSLTCCGAGMHVTLGVLWHYDCGNEISQQISVSLLKARNEACGQKGWPVMTRVRWPWQPTLIGWGRPAAWPFSILVGQASRTEQEGRWAGDSISMTASDGRSDWKLRRLGVSPPTRFRLPRALTRALTNVQPRGQPSHDFLYFDTFSFCFLIPLDSHLLQPPPYRYSP